MCTCLAKCHLLHLLPKKLPSPCQFIKPPLILASFLFSSKRLNIFTLTKSGQETFLDLLWTVCTANCPTQTEQVYHCYISSKAAEVSGPVWDTRTNHLALICVGFNVTHFSCEPPQCGAQCVWSLSSYCLVYICSGSHGDWVWYSVTIRFLLDCSFVFSVFFIPYQLM